MVKSEILLHVNSNSNGNGSLTAPTVAHILRFGMSSLMTCRPVVRLFDWVPWPVSVQLCEPSANPQVLQQVA